MSFGSSLFSPSSYTRCCSSMSFHLKWRHFWTWLDPATTTTNAWKCPGLLRITHFETTFIPAVTPWMVTGLLSAAHWPAYRTHVATELVALKCRTIIITDYQAEVLVVKAHPDGVQSRRAWGGVVDKYSREDETSRWMDTPLWWTIIGQGRRTTTMTMMMTI